MNRTLISVALSVIISASSFADCYVCPTDIVGHKVVRSDFGSFSRGYLGSVTDVAATEWSTPKSDKEAAISVLRELMDYANVTAVDLKVATSAAAAFFHERAIEPPSMVRIVSRHDPEDGRGYLRVEFPISVGSSEELADIDFGLSMRVAGLLSSGTENLLVSVVRA